MNPLHAENCKELKRYVNSARTQDTEAYEDGGVSKQRKENLYKPLIPSDFFWKHKEASYLIYNVI